MGTGPWPGHDWYCMTLAGMQRMPGIPRFLPTYLTAFLHNLKEPAHCPAPSPLPTASVRESSVWAKDSLSVCTSAAIEIPGPSMQGTLARPPPSAISLVNDTEYGGWARAGQYNRGTIRGAEHGPTMRGILTSVPSPGPRETCLGRNPARCARPAAGCTSQLLYQGWCRDGQDTAAQHTQDTAQHTQDIPSG